MKKIIIALLFLSLTTVASAQQSGKVLAVHVKDATFSEFCSIIYAGTKVKVFYRTDWVSALKVNMNADSISAFMAVSEALKGTDLQVSEWHGNLVILPGDKLLAGLPLYESMKNPEPNPDSGVKALTASEERYITGRRADAVQTITVGRKGGPVSGNIARLLGRVQDEETGEPLIAATIYIAEIRTGAVSDLNGFISFNLRPGKYDVLFEYLGYGKKKYQLEVLSDGNFEVTMKKSVIQMQEVVVYGDRQMNIRAKDPGLDKLSIKAIRELPMMMGERDILKVSSTLPGIVSVGEGSAGLNVRGGGSDQNAFYINKIPIYNTSHLFGFFPAFNSDIIKDFSIYKGHIPAQYGGHLSSVFNIVTRQGNRKKFSARGGISPITGNLVVEGPIKKDTSSFMFSARSSYSDWILKRLNDYDIRNSSAGFNDFSGGVNYDIRKTQLAVFGYRSYDRFRLSDLNSYEYSNNGLSASVSRNFTNSLRGEFSVVGSQYGFSTVNTEEKSSSYEHEYKMEHYEFKVDFKQVLSNKNSLEYGIGTVLYKLNRGTVMPYGLSSLRKRVDLGSEQGYESSVYISDMYDITPLINLTVGARYTLFTPTGPKTVYQYAEGVAMDSRNIVDSITFSANSPIRWYHQPDLRIAINFETDESGSVKLAFNQMHQNLFMLSNTVTVAPNTQWKLADYHIKPSGSNQFSAGVFRTIAKYGLDVSAEIYYKQTRNFPEFKDGANFLDSPLVETSVLQGDQKAWGIEVYLKRSLHKIDGWISYTYSRSMILVTGDEDWLKINGGEAYPANFDIPHSLNLVLNYHINRRITLASIVTYQSGKPVTYPVSVYYIDGIPVLDYSKRNAYRIPDYVRADLSLTIEGNLKKKKLLHSSLIFSVYNALGRENPYSVYFKTENGAIRSYRYAVIGVPILTATWLFKLGNYASE